MTSTRHALLFLGLLLAGPGCTQQSDTPAARSAAPANAETVTLIHYQAPVPEAWTAREPSSTMRAAEYETPGADGEEGAEVVVYYFGPGQGGSVEDNVARWTSQFTAPDGGHVAPEVTRFDDTALPTTLASFEGTYARNVGMGMGPGEARPDQALLAAVVETPEGNLFVQMFGPRASVEAQQDAYEGFVRGIKP